MIKLGDVDHLWSHFGSFGPEPLSEEVRKESFIFTIERCRWHGPYKRIENEYYSFYSIWEQGDNEYYVELGIFLGESHEQIIYLHYYKNSARIA